eukprot:Pgem_evm1s12101
MVPGGKISRVILLKCDDAFLNTYIGILHKELQETIPWCLKEEFSNHVKTLIKKLSEAKHGRSKCFRDPASMQMCYNHQLLSPLIQVGDVLCSSSLEHNNLG